MKENMVKEACNALSISNKESLGNYVSVDIASLAAGQYTLDVWIYIVGAAVISSARRTGFASASRTKCSISIILRRAEGGAAAGAFAEEEAMDQSAVKL